MSRPNSLALSDHLASQCHTLSFTSVRFAIGAILVVGILALSANTAFAAEILTNGNFEAGNFTGWFGATENSSGPASAYYTRTYPSNTPISNQATASNASGGTTFAVSDQNISQASTLYQNFTLAGASPSVILSYDMFVNNGGPTVVNNTGTLDANSPAPNAYARVDILANGANPFTSSSGILRNFYIGADGGARPNAYTHYSFDITNLVGGGAGTYTLRFAEINNQGFVINQGVDNVSIASTPEPASLSLAAMAGIVLMSRRRKTMQPGT